MARTMKFISLFTAIVISSAFLCGYVIAETARCKEKAGYIERQSLLTLVDLDCSDNEVDGLCSILLSAPKKVEDRKFALFTFLRRSNATIETYLNLKTEYYKDKVRVGFEFTESGAESITISSVYENIGGCTLKSSVNLGELVEQNNKAK